MKNRLYIFISLCLVLSCKKKDSSPIPEPVSENQQKIQGKWTQVHFKRYDYNNGSIDRVVEGDITTGEYVEFFGNRYRFDDGSKLIDDGNTFSFNGEELAIRSNNTIFYSTIKWQSADAYIEIRDDGSGAGGPKNKSVFEYSYLRKSN